MPLLLPAGARIVAATHNAGKAKELAALMEARFEVVAAASLGPKPFPIAEFSLAGPRNRRGFGHQFCAGK